jgi:hypothetical protein
MMIEEATLIKPTRQRPPNDGNYKLTLKLYSFYRSEIVRVKLQEWNFKSETAGNIIKKNNPFRPTNDRRLQTRSNHVIKRKAGVCWNYKYKYPEVKKETAGFRYDLGGEKEKLEL